MTNGKNPIRIPFTVQEHETILTLSKRAHLKKQTLITSYLLTKFTAFEERNQDGISLNFAADAKAVEIVNPIYVFANIEIDVYERIKKVSAITNISVPQFCRYLLTEELHKGERK